MRICDLEVGEFYIIKTTTRKKVFIKEAGFYGLALTLSDGLQEENKIYKESYYQYIGKTIKKVEKRLDSKRKEVYTYRPHMMLCLKTGQILRVSGYFIQNFFIKPEK